MALMGMICGFEVVYIETLTVGKEVNIALAE
jgi:hypothetical protein